MNTAPRNSVNPRSEGVTYYPNPLENVIPSLVARACPERSRRNPPRKQEPPRRESDFRENLSCPCLSLQLGAESLELILALAGNWELATALWL